MGSTATAQMKEVPAATKADTQAAFLEDQVFPKVLAAPCRTIKYNANHGCHTYRAGKARAGKAHWCLAQATGSCQHEQYVAAKQAYSYTCSFEASRNMPNRSNMMPAAGSAL